MKVYGLRAQGTNDTFHDVRPIFSKRLFLTRASAVAEIEAFTARCVDASGAKAFSALDANITVRVVEYDLEDRS